MDGGITMLIDQTGPFTYVDQLLELAERQGQHLHNQPRLLDMRCGNGQLAQRFAAIGWSVIAMDVCEGLTQLWKGCLLYTSPSPRDS